MSEPAAGAFEDTGPAASLRLVAAAEGGRAALFEEALEGMRPWLAGADLTGEKVDIAELGRSGARFAAICFFCAAIISLKLDLLAVCDDLRSGLEPLLLEMDDEREDAFGLFGSLSRSCCDLTSSVDIMLKRDQIWETEIVRTLLTSPSYQAKSWRKPSRFLARLPAPEDWRLLNPS